MEDQFNIQVEYSKSSVFDCEYCLETIGIGVVKFGIKEVFCI